MSRLFEGADERAAVIRRRHDTPDEPPHLADRTRAMNCTAVIERVQWGRGFVLVSGWLAAPRGEPWPERVLLQIGEHAFAISHWFPRADLPDQADGPSYLSFREDLPWPLDGSRGVSVGLHLGTANVPLAVAPDDVMSDFVPFGHLEAVSQASVSGWIFDPGLWHGDGSAMLWLDGEPLARVTLAIQRPDIVSAAASRGQCLGFYVDADELGMALRTAGPVFDGAERRWSVTSSGVEVASVLRALHPISRGRLEGFRAGLVRGWAALTGHPDKVVTVTVSLNGTPAAEIRCGRPRDDLRAAGITSGFGGFVLPFRFDPTGTGAPVIEVRLPGEREPLPGSPMTVRDIPLPVSASGGPWRGLARGRPRVSVIVPVHNAPDDLARCLASVIANTNGAARLIVIDDASTDTRVAAVLEAYAGHPGIDMHRNVTNLGFTATCNRGIALAGQDDVVLLNSDTVVPTRWLEGLIAAAYSGPGIASATPLSDNAGPFSVPEASVENPPPAGLDVGDISRLIAQSSLVSYPEAPTGHGFCLYLRRDALDAIGVLDEVAFPRGYGEENDLCMRALRAGLRNVVDDRTYVRHRRSASFGLARGDLVEQGRAVIDARYPEYGRLVRAFVGDEVMEGVRWRVRHALAAARVPRPRVLFVIATETGGTPQTNLDLMRALEDRYEPWLLRSDGQQLRLWRLVGGGLEDVSTHLLSRPIAMPVHRSSEYDAVVAELLMRHAIELVHIRHLAWHGLDLPLVARALGIPVVLSLHDFYISCPTIKLLDGALRHCEGRCAQGRGECRAELWPEHQVPPLRDGFLPRWREMMGATLPGCDAFVTTSPTARALLQDAFPELREVDFRVITHGRSFASLTPPGEGRRAAGPLRVLVPGSISPAKGANLIRAMAARDGGRRVEFHLLGDPGDLEPMPGLVLHGRYARDSFVEHATAIAPDIGAVLSIWPETYSHTLTELWAAGLPVFGLDLGAVGERIRACGGGWLSASRDPDDLLEALAAIDPEGDEIARRRTGVRAWQESEGLARDVHAMAYDYDVLYREIAHRRRAFPAVFEPPQAWLLVDVRREQAGGPAPALVNRPGGPVVFRPTVVTALPAVLQSRQAAGVVVLCDAPTDDAAAPIAGLCDLHGVACAFCPTRTPGEDDQPLAWPVLDPEEPPVSAQARIAASRAPTDATRRRSNAPGPATA